MTGVSRYWNADSDRDWQDACGMYDEPEPEKEKMTHGPDLFVTLADVLDDYCAKVGSPEEEEEKRVAFLAGVISAFELTRRGMSNVEEQAHALMNES
jgi:hypothetical protein